MFMCLFTGSVQRDLFLIGTCVYKFVFLYLFIFVNEHSTVYVFHSFASGCELPVSNLVPKHVWKRSLCFKFRGFHFIDYGCIVLRFPCTHSLPTLHVYTHQKSLPVSEAPISNRVSEPHIKIRLGSCFRYKCRNKRFHTSPTQTGERGSGAGTAHASKAVLGLHAKPSFHFF